MKRFLAFFLCIVVSVFVYPQNLCNASVTEPGNLYAKAAVLMDGDSGRVLFDKNGDVTLPMASTTKIMTCILALEKSNLKDIATVSKKASGQPEVHLGMREGQKFYLGDLLYSLMLESHNDSAVAIAEHVGGDVHGFAKLMNEKAKEIGCRNTYYITPNGLDASDENGKHATTATELARVMRYCITQSPAKEEFLKITGTKEHHFADAEGKGQYQCQNHNAFLDMMEGAISGKTGFTAEAGYCYVGAVKRDKRLFIVALLACGWPNNKTYKWKDTRTLMDYGIANYTYRDVYQKPKLGSIPVERGVPDRDHSCEPLDTDGNEKCNQRKRDTKETSRMNAQAYVPVKVDTKSEKLEVLLRQDEKVEMEIEIPKKLYAPVSKGVEVGRVTYRLNGTLLQRYPIVTTEAVKEKNMAWYFAEIIKHYFGVAGKIRVLEKHLSVPNKVPTNLQSSNTGHGRVQAGILHLLY